MISPSINKEIAYIDSGRDVGATGGWIASGVGFLFLVFIIFGIGFFLNSQNNNHRDHVTETIRDRTNLSVADLLTAAQERGASLARQQATEQNTSALLNEMRELQLMVTNGTQRAVDMTREAGNRIVEFGLSHGFRSFDVVYPDPCGHRRERDATFVLTPPAAGTLLGKPTGD